MRIFLATVTSMALITSCVQEEEARAIDTDMVTSPATGTGDIDSVNTARFEFESETFDFGKISQGEKVAFTYKFKNAGNRDLIISSARGSCGCTVPEYPKQPIAPGEEAEIKVVFDSEGKSGKTSKSVTLIANTYPSTTVLHVTGDILVPEGELKTND